MIWRTHPKSALGWRVGWSRNTSPVQIRTEYRIVNKLPDLGQIPHEINVLSSVPSFYYTTYKPSDI